MMAQVAAAAQQTETVALVDWLAQLQNFGLAAFLLGIVLFGLYRFVSFILHKLFDKDGLADKWVADNKKFYDTLTERLELINVGQEKQQEMCDRHADLMETVGDSMAEGVTIQKEAVRQLGRLVEIHEAPAGTVTQATKQISDMRHDIDRGKKALRHACEMCRRVSEKEFPNSASEVARHCDEIEKAIGEA